MSSACCHGPIIARDARPPYLSAVAFLFRLLALAAMILMPIGMGTAPAAAAAPSSHASMSAELDGHCGQKPDGDPTAPTAMSCGGTCSALLADSTNVATAGPAPVVRASAARVGALRDVLLPLSTPPPRLG